jgi:hypothetical protein
VSGPKRPMLSAVLDALTERTRIREPSGILHDGRRSRVVISHSLHGVVLSVHGVSVTYPWITTDPAEAWELLQTRDLIPMDYVGRFVCEACAGGGVVACGLAHLPCLRCALPCVGCGGSGRVGNAVCDCVGSLRSDAVALGHTPHPPTVAELAAWASLGFAASDDGSPGILGAEELMGELSGGTPTRWRVTPVTDIPTSFFRNESARRLNAAGFGWSGAARYRTLYVPPLGVLF